MYFAYKYYLHQIKSYFQVDAFLKGQRRDFSIFRSNRQSFHTSMGPHSTKYWGYQDHGLQAATQGPSTRTRFASETLVRIISRDTGSTFTPK